MQKIMPCLWFNFNAEEAINHYLSIFKNSKIKKIQHYGNEIPEHKGKVITIIFEIEGREFRALNAGTNYPFTEAISLSVDCADQAEVDMLWERLSAGGSAGPCGWLKDKFGLSWQIVPQQLMSMLDDPDSLKVERVMKAMMMMSKLDIATLEQAYK